MEILMSVMIGIIFTVSIYLFLSRSLVTCHFGTLLLSHGVHLLLMTMSELQEELTTFKFRCAKPRIRCHRHLCLQRLS